MPRQTKPGTPQRDPRQRRAGGDPSPGRAPRPQRRRWTCCCRADAQRGAPPRRHPHRPYDLHDTREAGPLRAQHRAAQLLEHRPRCLVPAETELPLELDRREPQRMGCDQIGRCEPEPERDPRPMQYRAGRHRYLVPTRSALKELAPCQLVGAPTAASRAEKAVRPPACHQVAPAIFLRREAILELDQRARKVRPCHGRVPRAGRCPDTTSRGS